MGLRPRRNVSRVVDASRRARHARVRVVHAVVCRTRGALRVRAVVGIVHRVACVAIRARSAGAGGGASSQVLVRTARGEQSSTASDARSHVRGSRRFAGVPWKDGLPDRRRQGGHRESERANCRADSADCASCSPQRRLARSTRSGPKRNSSRASRRRRPSRTKFQKVLVVII